MVPTFQNFLVTGDHALSSLDDGLGDSRPAGPPAYPVANTTTSPRVGTGSSRLVSGRSIPYKVQWLHDHAVSVITTILTGSDIDGNEVDDRVVEMMCFWSGSTY